MWRSGKVSIAVGMLIVTASPAMAAMFNYGDPVNYSESWEYAGGTVDSAYQETWATVSGEYRYSINSISANTGDKHLVQIANTAGYGISNALADDVELPPRASILASDERPLAVGFHWNSITTDRQNNSGVLELAHGSDYHAPPVGQSCDPIPVIAISNGMGQSNRLWFFNGDSWYESGTILDPGVYHDIVMTFTDATVGKNVSVTLDGEWLNDYYVDMQAFPTETFDTVSVRSFAGTTSHSYIDDLYMIGGEVVPEPMTLMMIGLSCLWLPPSRRRQAKKR